MKWTLAGRLWKQNPTERSLRVIKAGAVGMNRREKLEREIQLRHSEEGARVCIPLCLKNPPSWTSTGHLCTVPNKHASQVESKDLQVSRRTLVPALEASDNRDSDSISMRPVAFPSSLSCNPSKIWHRRGRNPNRQKNKWEKNEVCEQKLGTEFLYPFAQYLSNIILIY